MVQYILTEEEYSSLNKKIKENKGLPSKKELQEFCTLVADKMPIEAEGYWRDGKPWGCMITKEKEDSYNEWYCDKCPAQNICPYPHKGWSK